MKKALLICLLLAYGLKSHAQYTLYDSAARYRMSPSFDVAMDTLVAHAAAAVITTKLLQSNTVKTRYFL